MATDLSRNLKIFISAATLLIPRFDSDGMNYGYGKAPDPPVFVSGLILRLRLGVCKDAGVAVQPDHKCSYPQGHLPGIK